MHKKTLLARKSSPILSCSIAALLAAPVAQAATLYWDTNSTASGAGLTATGIWGSNNFWNTDSTGGAGGAFQITTTSADNLVFVAGPATDSGSNAFTVTVTGTQAANGLTFLSSGNPTITGGTISLGAGGILIPQWAYVSGTNVSNCNKVTIASSLNLTADQTWSVNNLTNNSSLSISGDLMGTGNIVLTTTAGNAAARLTFQSGSSTNWTGALTINGGGVYFASSQQMVTRLNNSTLTLKNSGGATSGVNLGLDIGGVTNFTNNINFVNSGAYGFSFNQNLGGGSVGGVEVLLGVISGTSSGNNVLFSTGNSGDLSGVGLQGQIRLQGNNSGWVSTRTPDALYVRAGYLYLDNANAIGNNNSLPVLLGQGSAGTRCAAALLTTNGINVTAPIKVNLNASGSGVPGEAYLGLDGAGSALISGSIILQNGTTSLTNSTTSLHLRAQPGATVTFSGNINDGGTSTSFNDPVIADWGGTVVLTGTGTFWGNTIANAGTLQLNFSNRSGATNILNSTANRSALVLGGGGLALVGKASTNNSQQFNGATVGAGASTVSLAANAIANNLLLTLGALTRTAAGTVDFTLPADAQSGSNGVTTTSTTFVSNNVLTSAASNGIAFATVGGADWASLNGGNIVAIPSYNTNSFTSTDNTDVTSDQTPASDLTVNTLRFNDATARAVTLSGTNTVSTGGILVTSTAALGATLTGGSLQAGGGKELVLINNGGVLAIGSAIVDNATASALTISGTGVTTLSGANTYAGVTTVNGGTLSVANIVAASGSSNLGNATSPVVLGDNGHKATLSYTGNSATYTRGFIVGAGGAEIDVTTAGQTLTVSTGSTAAPTVASTTTQGKFGDLTIGGAGNVTFGSTLALGWGGLTMAGSGTLTLSASNSYTGTTMINAGTMKLGISTGLPTSSPIVINGGILDLGGFSSSSITASATLNGGMITNGTLNLNSAPFYITSGTISANIYSQGTSLFGCFNKSGPGTVALTGADTYSGPTTVNAGTLQIGLGGATGAIGSTSGIALSSSATLAFNRTDNYGGNFSRVVSGSGNVVLNSGTLIVTSTNTYTGATTVASGTLQVGAGGTIGSIASTNGVVLSATNSALAFNRTDNYGGSFSIPISGSGSVLLSAGALTLTGSNSYSGGTTITGGTLSIGASNNIGASASSLVFNGGGLQITGTSLTNFSGNNHTVVFTSGKAVSLDIDSALNTFSVDQALNQGSGTFTKLGLGTALLTASNNYTGATTISAGTLQIGDGSNGLIATNGTVTTGSAGTLVVNLVTGGTLGNALANSGVINLIAGGTNTLSGIISGTGALNQNGTGTTVLNATDTYTGPTTVNAGTLQVGAGGTAGSSGSTSGIALASGATLAFSRTDTYGGNFAPVISGSGAVVVNSGTLSLTSANTYTGLTTVNAGKLQIGAGGTVGSIASTSGIVLSTTNATFGFNRTDNYGGSFSTLISGSGNVVLTAGALTITGSNTYTGATTVTSGTLQIGDGITDGSTGSTSGIANSGALVFNLLGNQASATPVSGTGALIKTGPGTLTLTGSNAYTGATTLTSGTLQIGDGTSGSLAAGSTVTVSTAGVLAINLANGGVLGSQINNSGGVVNFTSSGTNTLSGYLGGWVSAAMNQSGSGTTIISGNNQFYGTTNITAGVLQLNSQNAAQDSTVNVGVDNSLVFGTSPVSLGGLAGSGNVVMVNGTNAIALTIGLNNIDCTYFGALSGSSSSLTKSGSGTLTLAGSNTYSGGTTISTGTLQLGDGTSGHDGSLATNYMTNNGTVIFNLSGSQTAGYIIAGSGAVIKSGSGTLALSAANSFTGGITLNAGTLAVNNSTTALGANSNTLVINGGALDNTSGTSIINGQNYKMTWNSDFAFLGASDGTHDLNLGSGAIGLGAAVGVSRTVTVNAGTFTVAGVIANGTTANSLIKSGNGTLVLKGASTFTGGVTLNAGTLALTNAASLGATSGTFTINGGTVYGNSSVTLNAYSQIWNGDFGFGFSSMIADNSLNLGTGAVSLGSGSGTSRTVTANGVWGTLTVGGVISDGATANSLIKSGPGILTLTGTNTFTGGMTVNAGTLTLGNAFALGSGTLTINAGGFNNNGASLTLSTNNPQVWNGDFSYVGGGNGYVLNFGNGAVTLGGNITVTSVANTLTELGAIGDSGSNYGLTLVSGIANGNATNIYLSGSGTYGGATVVKSMNGLGSVYLDTGYLANTSSVTVNGGAIFKVGTIGVAGVTNRINPAATLTLGGADGGGSFLLRGSQNPVVNKQSFTSISIGAGANSLYTDNSGNVSQLTITGANPYTRSVGGVMRFIGLTGTFTTAPSGAGNVIGSGTNAILIGATYQAGTTISDVNGFVRATSGAIGAVTTSGETYASGVNTDLGLTSFAVPTSGVTQSIRINGSMTLSLPGAFTLESGGLVASNNPAAPVTVTGGSIKTGIAGGDLWIVQGGLASANTGIIINSQIADNSGSSLTKVGPRTLYLSGTNNTYSGGTYLAEGILNIASEGSLGIGALNFTGAGTLQAAGNVALGSRAISIAPGLSATFDTNGNNISANGVISGSNSGLIKNGTGMLTLGGSNSYTGPTTVTNGTLKLDFSAPGAPVSNIVNPSSVLAPGVYAVYQGPANVASSATVMIQGADNTANTQTFSGTSPLISIGSTTIGMGMNHLNFAAGTNGTLTVNLGSIVKGGFAGANGLVNTGLDIAIGTGVTVTTSDFLNRGILNPIVNGIGNGGAWVTVNGTSWATLSGSTIIPLANSSYVTNLASNTDNTDVVTSGTLANLSSSYSLRFNDTNNTGADLTVSLKPTATTQITGGPVLVTSNVGAHTSTITGGYLIGYSRRALDIFQNNTLGDLVIGSVLVDANGSQGVDKYGVGRLVLTATNSLSGSTFVNEGTILATGDYTPAVTSAGAIVTAGTNVVTVTDATGIFLGQAITGTGIASANATVVTAISGTTITLSANSTVTGTSNLYFASGAALGGFNPTIGNFPNVFIGTSGTLQLGDGGTHGSLDPNSSISNLGAMILNRSDAYSFGNPISGSVAINSLGGTVGVNTLQVIGGGTCTLGFSGAPSGAAASGTNIYNLAAAGNVNAGMTVSGSGIAAGTVVTSVDGTSVKLSTNTTGAVSNITFTTVNAFNGVTKISGNSTLVLGAPAALGSSTLDYDTSYSGTFSFGPFSTVTLGGLKGNQDLELTSTSGSAVALTVGGNHFDTTYSGNLSGAGSLTKAGIGTLTLTGSSSYGGGTTVSAGTLKGNALSLLGNISAASSSSVIFDQNTPGLYAGAITGAGNFIKTGSDTLTVSGSSTNTGLIDVQAGTLVTGASERLSNNSPLRISGGTLDISSFTESVTAVTMTSGTIAGTTGQLNGLSYNFTDSGMITAALGGNATIAKSGTGTVTLAGNSTQNGAITINGGTLQLGNGGTTGSLQVSSAIVNNATLAFNRSDTLTQGVNFASTISGSGNVIQAGSGTTILSGSNSFSGGSIVSSGTLQIGNANALGSGALTVNGGTLNLHGTDVSVPGLSGAGGTITNTLSGTSTLTATIASGTSNYAGNIADGTGGVALTKQGSGKLILGGSLSMAGLNANSGVVELAQSGSIGAVTVSGSGAVALTAHTGAYKVLDTSSLSITAGGNIDLWNNAMILRASGTSENAINLTAVKAAVNAASNGLQWNGAGLGSTTAFSEAQPEHTQALALMVYDNSVIKQGSFEGVSGLGYFDGDSQPVGFNQVLVKLTYLGDFNADGVVNASDYTWLDGFALGANPLGDLNGDGVVNATDYTWLDGSALNQSFGVLAGQQSGGGVSPLAPAAAAVPAGTGAIAASPEAVPEPGALGLLFTGALGLLGIRRQRKNRSK